MSLYIEQVQTREVVIQNAVSHSVQSYSLTNWAKWQTFGRWHFKMPFHESKFVRDTNFVEGFSQRPNWQYFWRRSSNTLPPNGRQGITWAKGDTVSDDIIRHTFSLAIDDSKFLQSKQHYCKWPTVSGKMTLRELMPQLLYVSVPRVLLVDIICNCVHSHDAALVSS